MSLISNIMSLISSIAADIKGIKTDITTLQSEPSSGQVYQVGDIVYKSTTPSEPDWLLCDGSSYNDIEYPALSAVLKENGITQKIQNDFLLDNPGVNFCFSMDGERLFVRQQVYQYQLLEAFLKKVGNRFEFCSEFQYFDNSNNSDSFGYIFSQNNNFFASTTRYRQLDENNNERMYYHINLKNYYNEEYRSATSLLNIDNQIPQIEFSYAYVTCFVSNSNRFILFYNDKNDPINSDLNHVAFFDIIEHSKLNVQILPIVVDLGLPPQATVHSVISDNVGDCVFISGENTENNETFNILVNCTTSPPEIAPFTFPLDQYIVNTFFSLDGQYLILQGEDINTAKHSVYIYEKTASASFSLLENTALLNFSSNIVWLMISPDNQSLSATSVALVGEEDHLIIKFFDKINGVFTEKRNLDINALTAQYGSHVESFFGKNKDWYFVVTYGYMIDQGNIFKRHCYKRINDEYILQESYNFSDNDFYSAMAANNSMFVTCEKKYIGSDKTNYKILSFDDEKFAAPFIDSDIPSYIKT